MQELKTQPIILVVEDYADSRQMLKLLLEGQGYCVVTAGNGREALSAVSHHHVDLILTDFGLPDITGATLVRRLHQFSELRRVPVIMLTAYDGDEYRNLAAEAGCNAFIVKPPRFEILTETLDRLLKSGREQTADAISGEKVVVRSLPCQAVRT